MVSSLRIQLAKLSKYFCSENKSAPPDTTRAPEEDEASKEPTSAPIIGAGGGVSIPSLIESDEGKKSRFSYSLNDMGWCQWT
jgi:hypothetical protein